MLRHGTYLQGVARCPHCAIANPSLGKVYSDYHGDHEGHNSCRWAAYLCQSCGGISVARGEYNSTSSAAKVTAIYPELPTVNEDLPPSAKRYLEQALESVHSPDGAAMLAGSAVDAMLKDKGYTKGWLSTRIQQAAQDGVITEGMKNWADHIRLESNNPRHADADRPHLTEDEARQSIEFAFALGQFMFVLPTRVEQGLQKATDQQDGDTTADK